MFLDGTLDGHTASLHHPYGDNPSKLGFLTLDVDIARARMETAHLAGLQICVQAVGDAANAAALDLFTDLLSRHCGDNGPRHRIAHASILDDGAAERFAELGITAVVQPRLLETQRPWLAHRVGPERSPRTYPLRSLVDLAEGLRSDLVVLSHDPTELPADQIAAIDVRLTVVGGRVVHRRGI